FQRSCERKYWLPFQLSFRFGGIQLQEMSFVRMRGLVQGPRSLLAPQLRDAVCEPRNRSSIGVHWAKVPGGCVFSGILREALSKHKIATKRFKDELPWTDGERVSNHAGFSGKKGAHQIRDELIARPISSTDGVARAGRTKGDTMVLMGIRR